MPTEKLRERDVICRFFHYLIGGTPGQRAWTDGRALYWYDRPVAVWSEGKLVIVVGPDEVNAALYRLRKWVLRVQRLKIELE